MLGLWTQVLGTWAHAVDEGQAFTDAESRESEVEVEKDLAVAFFVAAIARLGDGGYFSAAAVQGTHPSESWSFCALNVADNLN
jgi:hypothetical protein